MTVLPSRHYFALWTLILDGGGAFQELLAGENGDFKEVGYRQQSASYIDGVIFEDTVYTDRVCLIIDAFAWN